MFDIINLNSLFPRRGHEPSSGFNLIRNAFVVLGGVWFSCGMTLLLSVLLTGAIAATALTLGVATLAAFIVVGITFLVFFILKKLGIFKPKFTNSSVGDD